jgi:hypothetical protein
MAINCPNWAGVNARAGTATHASAKGQWGYLSYVRFTSRRGVCIGRLWIPLGDPLLLPSSSLGTGGG